MASVYEKKTLENFRCFSFSPFFSLPLLIPPLSHTLLPVCILWAIAAAVMETVVLLIFMVLKVCHSRESCFVFFLRQHIFISTTLFPCSCYVHISGIFPMYLLSKHQFRTFYFLIFNFSHPQRDTQKSPPFYFTCKYHSQNSNSMLVEVW